MVVEFQGYFFPSVILQYPQDPLTSIQCRRVRKCTVYPCAVAAEKPSAAPTPKLIYIYIYIWIWIYSKPWYDFFPASESPFQGDYLGFSRLLAGLDVSGNVAALSWWITKVRKLRPKGKREPWEAYWSNRGRMGDMWKMNIPPEE